MRPPRVRFTVGTLLFTVAVVAANLWGFRLFYDVLQYSGGDITFLVVGLLPLLNVTLIGLWLFAVKRIRFLRRGNSAKSWSRLSGVTYFGLQLLLLGCLVGLYMPTAVQSAEEVVSEITDTAGEFWETRLGQPPESAAWVVFISATFGVLVSGPLLLLCWIGQTLAARSAATLPRRRFGIMIGLTTLGFAGADLAICMTPRPFGNGEDVALDFQVVDDATGQPIKAAFVRVVDPFSANSESPAPGALTDENGRVWLNDRFWIHGERNAFSIMGWFSPWGRWLEVSAKDHAARRVPLTEVMDQVVDPVRPTTWRVALKRGETPSDFFRDIAGTYSWSVAYGNAAFTIEPDGRFAWRAGGHRPPESQEYGYCKRNGKIIEFLSIPASGGEVHPLMTLKYLTIEWGGRLYLTAVDDHRVLRKLCRAALSPRPLPAPDDIIGCYLRDSDRDKPRTGLPRLPVAVWAKFLVDETNLRDPESGLRLAVDSLVPGHARR